MCQGSDMYKEFENFCDEVRKNPAILFYEPNLTDEARKNLPSAKDLEEQFKLEIENERKKRSI